MTSHRNRAVFLDRDGVLVEHVHYLSKPGDLRLTPGAARSLRSLRAAGFKTVLVTNQSGVGRGYFTLRQLHKVHRRLREMLARGKAKLDAIYYCPHAPPGQSLSRRPGGRSAFALDRAPVGQGPPRRPGGRSAFALDRAPAPKPRACSCRKPASALFQKAAKRFAIDLKASFVVGDSTSDIMAARNIGATAILVKTGYGGSDGRHRVRADKTCRDLAGAARWILQTAKAATERRGKEKKAMESSRLGPSAAFRSIP